RIGLTISASRVPFSRSRTTDTAIAVIVVCIRRAPMSPGTMKMAETRSGLYQARTRTSSGGGPPGRPADAPSPVRGMICSQRRGRVDGRGRHERIGGVHYDLDVRGLTRELAPEVRGNDHADLRRALVDEPGQLGVARDPVEDVEVLGIGHRVQKAPRLGAPRL